MFLEVPIMRFLSIFCDRIQHTWKNFLPGFLEKKRTVPFLAYSIYDVICMYIWLADGTER